MELTSLPTENFNWKLKDWSKLAVQIGVNMLETIFNIWLFRGNNLLASIAEILVSNSSQNRYYSLPTGTGSMVLNLVPLL